MPNSNNTTSTAALAELAQDQPTGTATARELPKMVCDLAQADAFVGSRRTPHLPVLSAFGNGPLHICSVAGLWDLNRLLEDHGQHLIRSIHLLPSKVGKQAEAHWDDLTLELKPQTYIYADTHRVVTFATTPAEAEQLATEFAKTYNRPQPPTDGDYYLIQKGMEIECHKVPLPAQSRLTRDLLEFHYGQGSEEWNRNFLKELRARDRGLSIFEGSPGTGKTFYIRHLIGELKDSHRFFFIPNSYLGILTAPEFIGFWAEQRQRHADMQFVVVLEDADAALMTRGVDNREEVSAILNLSDGLLADFLRLQIICTINCNAKELDPALLRPGRLICHRVFGRLDRFWANQLARKLGKELPEAPDYSLAEVFAGRLTEEKNLQRFGFAA